MKQLLILLSMLISTLVYSAENKQVSTADLAAHSTPGKCWILIHKGVYDISKFMAIHPAPKEILPIYCGKDVTIRFQTKGIGMPHSAEAKEIMKKYKIGGLKSE